MPLSAGEKLGPYEILGPIGAGGMGEVYRALDPRLGREVAIKIAAARFSERFEREARAVAALNHPNICTLHDVGPNYLVMELVDGKPPQGPLPLDLALRYATQIADALDGAHRKGIIHRDLKPANILVTRQGLKLLDFGLAKHVTPVSSDRELDKTLTKALTGEGTLLGTPQYMAPEQVEGKEADARSDIFAFGCVLYEMLSGRRAFDGNTHASVIAKILAGEPPPLRDLQPVTPRSLERVLATCLAKDPDERWQSAADLKHALALVTTEPAAAPAASAKRPWLWPAIAATLTLAALATGWFARPPEPPRSFQLSVNPPAEAEFVSAGTNAGNSALSPDGTMLAFSGRTKGRLQIWIRRLDSIVTRALPGTEGGYYPFWAPDSRRIGFFADGKLKKVDVSGGPAQTICDGAPGRGGTWSADGAILFSAGTTKRVIMRVSAAGGTPVGVTTLEAGENAHYWPWFLPDGRHFLYMSRSQSQEKNAIWVAALDTSSSRKRLVDAQSNVAYARPLHARLLRSETGHLLFAREQTLLAQPFDSGSLELKGDAFPVVEGVSYAPNIALADYSVSSNGILAYGSGQGGLRRLVWRDRNGKEIESSGKPADLSATWMRLAPDGKRAVFAKRERGTGAVDLWIADLERGTESRLTFDSADERGIGSAVWSPDSSQILFRGRLNIYRKAASGAGDLETILSAQELIPTDWSRDGRFVLLTRSFTNTLADLLILELGKGREPVPFLATPFVETGGRFSPDGRWIAYMSNESGTVQVYVQPFLPGRAASGARWQVSIQGGFLPVWRGDGKELFFRSLESKAMAVSVQVQGDVFKAGAPVALFETAAAGGTFEATRDGQRFLMIESVDQARSAPMTVIVNWQAAARK